MPGIVGTIGAAAGHTDIIEAMTASMMHEDFYESGSLARLDCRVVANWVAHRGAFGGAAWSQCRTFGLVFSGEHFPDIGASENGNGAPNHADEGVQSLLRQYEKSGTNFLRTLNGWFSGVLIDSRSHTVTIFNDRFGLGRVYYHQNRDGFYFASEAKALLKVLPSTRDLDPRSLGEWLACGCALQNRTLYREVALLPPGSAWTFSPDGRIEKRQYFNASEWESQESLPASDYIRQLSEIFPKVLKRYFQGNRPIGMSLTGGLDGRMIMACLPARAGGLPCYTFNGPYRDCADVRIGKRVARACRQTHQTIPVGRDFLKQFPQLSAKAVFVSDGNMDVTGGAELYVNRVAREIAPVRLTGNYGSEIVRRHVAFRPGKVEATAFAPEVAAQAQAAAGVYQAEASGNRLSFIAFKQVPWHHHARLSIEQSQLTVRSPFLDNDLVALVFRAPAEAATSLEPLLRLISGHSPELGRIPTDRGVTFPARPIANRARREVQEFLAKAEYAYDYGMPDWLARFDRAFAPLHLEKLFLGRQKFCHFRVWYRGELGPYVQEMLLDPRTRKRSYLNGARLEDVVTGHLRGTSNHTLLLHRLLTLELIQRQLIEWS